MSFFTREIEPKDNRSVEAVIRACLIEFGADHEGTAWADPDLGRFSEIYCTDGNGDYQWSDNKTNRFMEPATPQYRTDLQLFGIAADGTWVASKSN